MAPCPSGHESASDDFCDVCGVLIGAAPSLAADGTAASAAGEADNGGAAAPSPGETCPGCGTTRVGQFCESCGHDFASAGPATVDPGTYPPVPAPAVPGPPDPHKGVPGLPDPSTGVPAPPSPSTGVPAPPGPSTGIPRPPGPSSAVPGPPGASIGVPAPRGPLIAPAAPADGEWTAVVTADRGYYDAVQAAGGPDAAGIAFPAYFPQRRFRLAGTEVRIGRHSPSSGIDPEIDLSVPPADPGVSRLHAVLLRAPDGGWSVVDPGSANGTTVNGSEIPRGQAVPLRDGDRIHLGAWTELRVIRGGQA